MPQFPSEPLPCHPGTDPPRSLYLVRVLGALETASVADPPRDLILEARINDGPTGVTNRYVVRQRGTDNFYSLGEFFFYAEDRRPFTVDLGLHPDSRVDLLGHHVDVHDTLAKLRPGRGYDQGLFARQVSLIEMDSGEPPSRLPRAYFLDVFRVTVRPEHSHRFHDPREDEFSVNIPPGGADRSRPRMTGKGGDWGEQQAGTVSTDPLVATWRLAGEPFLRSVRLEANWDDSPGPAPVHIETVDGVRALAFADMADGTRLQAPSALLSRDGSGLRRVCLSAVCTVKQPNWSCVPRSATGTVTCWRWIIWING